MASVSCFMTSTRRICPLTFNVISRSTAPGAPGCPKMGARNRYAVDDTAAPAAITPLMNARRDTPRSGIMLASAISLSDIERLPCCRDTVGYGRDINRNGPLEARSPLLLPECVPRVRPNGISTPPGLRGAETLILSRSSAKGSPNYTVGPMARGSSVVAALILGTALTAAAAAGTGQFRRGGPFVRLATPQSFDGRFNFCRVAFRHNPRGDGGGWAVDYPRADIHMSVRLSELTKTAISLDGEGEPNHVVVRLTDDELFQCPFVMMTEVGAVYFDENEAKRLREYLLKGGFLWADDFWGSYAWQVWANEIGKVLPRGEYPIVDLPLDHPIFHTQFDVQRVQHISSTDFWWSSGGHCFDRGPDSADL